MDLKEGRVKRRGVKGRERRSWRGERGGVGGEKRRGWMGERGGMGREEKGEGREGEERRKDAMMFHVQILLTRIVLLFSIDHN